MRKRDVPRYEPELDFETAVLPVILPGLSRMRWNAARLELLQQLIDRSLAADERVRATEQRQTDRTQSELIALIDPTTDDASH